ncbi:MAG: hypothetical protein RPU61_03330 [Candidatus Sedimenticola sp. (ex Thyasira tokunagai)]
MSGSNKEEPQGKDIALAEKAAQRAGAGTKHARIIALEVVAEKHDDIAAGHRQTAAYTERSQDRQRYQTAAKLAEQTARNLRQQAKEIQEL